ncbi:hypothetical protein [Methylobacterium brachiatum]|uniref:hypothetical protein n=1 Tax=Methylobacterium brachiatum TaxID=269660 RepID=UPI0008EC3035|nr:hypothetical protein [Methylobacterium brachiatum]SFJ68839.1 hypothetical protein SAMN02799642_05186 [Methylobacterium brachiatum]
MIRPPEEPVTETASTPAATPAADVQRLKFLLRSGNAFMVDGVLDWGMKHLRGRVIGLMLKQATDAKYARVVVDSIDLSQIEAVVLLPAAGPGKRANE